MKEGREERGEEGREAKEEGGTREGGREITLIGKIQEQSFHINTPQFRFSVT